jgi:ubiquinone/menaquinone biosynthesis C-methylase UbiE
MERLLNPSSLDSLPTHSGSNSQLAGHDELSRRRNSSDEDSELLPEFVRVLKTYRAKRLLAFLIANSQSIRWATQGRILSRAVREFRKEGAKVLDVGCGGGSYAIENHLRHGISTTLCDYSEELLALARAQVSEAGVASGADFAQCSAEELPFSDGTFDFIQCMEVLEHLRHPERALAEFRRVARDGAHLIVSVPHPPEWFPNDGHVVEGYDSAEISKLLTDAGWRVIRVEYCMLIVSRCVIAINRLVSIPLPLNPLVALENLVPASWRKFLLPYDIVVLAERCV